MKLKIFDYLFIIIYLTVIVLVSISAYSGRGTAESVSIEAAGETYIYLLEPDAQRIVVIDKEGSYIAQYKSEQAEHAFSLAVSEKEKKIILLTGNKLYSIELEHLQ